MAGKVIEGPWIGPADEVRSIDWRCLRLRAIGVVAVLIAAGGIARLVAIDGQVWLPLAAGLAVIGTGLARMWPEPEKERAGHGLAATPPEQESNSVVAVSSDRWRRRSWRSPSIRPTA